MAKIESTRKFRGKTYYLFVGAANKGAALREAARLRKNGYLAMIYANPDSWSVYSNPKTPHWYSGAFLKKRK